MRANRRLVFLSSTSWCTIPFVFHQTHNMTFLTNLWGFGVPSGTWSGSNHFKPRWVLSNAIHFSSQVRIESKKLVFLAMERIDWQVTILWTLWFSVSLKGIHLPRLQTFPISCNPLIIVFWQHPNSIANSRLVTLGSASTAAFKDWRSRIWGRPLRGRSWRDRSPALNLANHRAQFRSVTASSGYKSLITCVVSLVLFPGQTWKAHMFEYRSLNPFKFFEW